LGEGTNIASVPYGRDLSTALILLIEESLKEGERLKERRVGILLIVGNIFSVR
jgi:hypothetical protein